MESTISGAGEPAWRLWLRRTPLGVVGVILLLLAIIWLLPEEWLPRGVQMMSTLFGTFFAALGVLIWALFFSGARLRARVALGVAVAAVAALAGGSIRRVEFSGDMVPALDFRWNESREARLEAHRRALAARRPADAAVVLAQLAPEDAPAYRGRARDGVVEGPPLGRDWAERAPVSIWRQPVGGGYAAMIVAGDTAITIEQRRENEAVVAYDAANGRELWVYEYPALFHEQLGGDGPRATPTLADGRIYALGATGVLTCLDGATGEPIWTVDVLGENQCQNVVWGLCSSPLVYDGLVVVVPGSQKGTELSRLIVAYDAQTGKRVWGQGQAQAAYTSPMLVTLGGKRQILLLDAEGVAGFDDQGRGELWRFPTTTQYDNAGAQPIVLPDDRVFFSNESGCGLLQIAESPDGTWSATPLWENRQMKCVYSNPIAVGDHVYGLDQGILACLDLKTGRRAWKSGKGRYGHGQLLRSGELLLVLAESGELVLVEPSPDEHRELGKLAALEGKTWNNPALVRGRAFVRNHLEMACYALPLAAASSTEAAAGGPPSHAQPRREPPAPDPPDDGAGQP